MEPVLEANSLKPDMDEIEKQSGNHSVGDACYKDVDGEHAPSQGRLQPLSTQFADEDADEVEHDVHRPLLLETEGNADSDDTYGKTGCAVEERVDGSLPRSPRATKLKQSGLGNASGFGWFTLGDIGTTLSVGAMVTTRLATVASSMKSMSGSPENREERIEDAAERTHIRTNGCKDKLKQQDCSNSQDISFDDDASFLDDASFGEISDIGKLEDVSDRLRPNSIDNALQSDSDNVGQLEQFESRGNLDLDQVPPFENPAKVEATHGNVSDQAPSNASWCQGRWWTFSNVMRASAQLSTEAMPIVTLQESKQSEFHDNGSLHTANTALENGHVVPVTQGEIEVNKSLDYALRSAKLLASETETGIACEVGMIEDNGCIASLESRVMGSASVVEGGEATMCCLATSEVDSEVAGSSNQRCAESPRPIDCHDAESMSESCDALQQLDGFDAEGFASALDISFCLCDIESEEISSMPQSDNATAVNLQINSNCFCREGNEDKRVEGGPGSANVVYKHVTSGVGEATGHVSGRDGCSFEDNRECSMVFPQGESLMKVTDSSQDEIPCAENTETDSHSVASTGKLKLAAEISSGSQGFWEAKAGSTTENDLFLLDGLSSDGNGSLFQYNDEISVSHEHLAPDEFEESQVQAVVTKAFDEAVQVVNSSPSNIANGSFQLDTDPTMSTWALIPANELKAEQPWEDDSAVSERQGVTVVEANGELLQVLQVLPKTECSQVTFADLNDSRSGNLCPLVGDTILSSSQLEDIDDVLSEPFPEEYGHLIGKEALIPISCNCQAHHILRGGESLLPKYSTSKDVATELGFTPTPPTPSIRSLFREVTPDYSLTSLTSSCTSQWGWLYSLQPALLFSVGAHQLSFSFAGSCTDVGLGPARCWKRSLEMTQLDQLEQTEYFEIEKPDKWSLVNVQQPPERRLVEPGRWLNKTIVVSTLVGATAGGVVGGPFASPLVFSVAGLEIGSYTGVALGALAGAGLASSLASALKRTCFNHSNNFDVLEPLSSKSNLFDEGDAFLMVEKEDLEEAISNRIFDPPVPLSSLPEWAPPPSFGLPQVV